MRKKQYLSEFKKEYTEFLTRWCGPICLQSLSQKVPEFIQESVKKTFFCTPLLKGEELKKVILENVNRIREKFRKEALHYEDSP